MWLSELYGRIGQILQEKGDMKVVRHRSLQIDGIIGEPVGHHVEFSSEDFTVLQSYKQIQIGDKEFIEQPAGKHFIINIPFN